MTLQKGDHNYIMLLSDWVEGERESRPSTEWQWPKDLVLNNKTALGVQPQRSTCIYTDGLVLGRTEHKA